jgi:hypothetical protein
MKCSACGNQCTLPFGADGHPVGFDASFTPGRFAKWLAAARHAMAGGMPGVAVGVCPKCDSPLVVSSKTPVTLPCPHCKKPVEGPAEQVLADQWPEPWCKVEGGQIDMEYRLAWNDEASGIVAGCPACGAPADPDDPTGRCRRCGAVTWVERGEGADRKKVQLALRVDGMRQGRPAKATLPLAQGEAALRADQMLGASADSGSSLLGVTGIGCAIAFAVLILLVIFIIVVAKR